MKSLVCLFASWAVLFLFVFVPSTEAQGSFTGVSTPATPVTSGAPTKSADPDASPATQTSDQPSVDKTKNPADPGEEDKPFVPHWSGQVGLTYSNQPSQQGQGQIQKELGLSGTYDFTEGGHFITVELIGGQQLVEGLDTNYGQFNLTGGLGLGIFLPSLELEMQQGASALVSNTALLTLNFRLFDPLEIGPILSAGLQSHQGPVSTAGLSGDRIVEIDSGDLSGGLMVTFIPWDFLTLSLTGQQEYDDTYEIQNIVHTTQIPENQRDRIPSLTLGENILCPQNFELDLSEQVGQEFYPAGTVYSPVLGRTVTFSKPTTKGFMGFSIGLMYNFE